MSEIIRSFLALDIEDKIIIRRLLKVQGMLVNTGADLKLVKPQNIHLTVRFLGDIPLPMVDAIHEEMKQLSFALFDIELRGIGTFPKRNLV